MAEFTCTHHIDAPPEIVFEYASDLARAPERIEGIVALEILTDGPVGVGTRFRETRVMFGREAVEEMEFTEFTPPERYVVEATSHGCHYETTYRFVPEDGGTKVEFVFRATALTMGAKIMSFVMAPLMRSCIRAIEKDLVDLGRAIAEDRAAAATES